LWAGSTVRCRERSERHGLSSPGHRPGIGHGAAGWSVGRSVRAERGLLHNGGGPSVTVLTSWWPLKSVAVDLGHAAFTLMPE
jgi:hypothetical protein